MSVWQNLKNAFMSPKSSDKQKQVVIVTNDENVPGQKRVDEMSDLTQVFQVENIAMDVVADSRAAALKYLAEFAQKLFPGLDQETLYGKYLLRERQATTELGAGVAIPHVQDSSINQLTMLVVKLKKPIKWTKNEEVNVLISFLIPDPERNYQHLAYFSTIARLLMQKNFVHKLSKAKNNEQIFDLFK
ncbi:hypothetical protein LCR01_13790 [Companilactobacillus crustorum]|nr:PTS sugar transporter subunit IIA [Companilactobacillus crustorum]APU71496.1 hypothetical protein BI355_1177 [Companilactobacillus crustorum]WDT66478.1 PTS sugar transporter subunit IIA [Companilactobacillus crustorum]GEO76936.1 hypothetical protein LCR01_13790 [Companilactobacillus crustorum]